MGWRIKEEAGNENEMKDERTTESESKEGRRKQHAGEGGGGGPHNLFPFSRFSSLYVLHTHKII